MQLNTGNNATLASNPELSVVIPVYNEAGAIVSLLREVTSILDNKICHEIIIVDDCSDEGFYKSLELKLGRLELESKNAASKIKLYRNKINLDCYRNKREAISKASNKWVIILDSDNVIDKSYLDALENNFYESNVKRVYCPEFARPNFDYRIFSGNFFHAKNCAFQTHTKQFHWLINTMNYCVNRDRYLKVWDGTIDPHTADTAYQNYNLIMDGCSLFVVPGMQYDHLVHSGSHYKNNVHKTGNLFEELIEKFKQMK